MELLISQSLGFVTGLIAGVLGGLWVAKHTKRGERREHVRQVSANITRTWTSVSGQPDMKMLTGGHLTIKNNSEWPVREIIVMSPDWMSRLDVADLGPGREHVEQIALEVLSKVEPGDDSPVTLQLKDDRDVQWVWTPAQNHLGQPSRIPVHARVVQWLARRYPKTVGRSIDCMPARVRSFLWGYDPVG